MKLWSIQSAQVWEVLQEHGVFRSMVVGMLDASWVEPYRWMGAQLSRRVGIAPRGCQWPIWAWQQWAGHAKPQPDLRASAHLPKGTIGVRLEIDVDPATVLLSDFELWHYVLNYWYLPTSAEDGDAFEQELAQNGLVFSGVQPLPEPYHSKITASWERIFDLDWVVNDIAQPRPDKAVQAVLWELNMQHVKKVQTFRAR